MPSFRVLVIDADPVTAELLDQTLTPKGHQIESAYDAATAMRIVERRPPDLIVLDPALPARDGYALARAIRAHLEASVVPILFLADRREAQEALQGFRLAADDFLPKPVDPREVEIRILSAMKRKQETDRRFRKPPAEEGEDWSVKLSGMRGTLSQIGLPTILSILDMERKSGILVVVVDGTKGKFRLEFRGGRLLRARLDGTLDPRNAELVFALFAQRSGRFDFRPCVVVTDDEVQTSTSTLLLEGARRLDESKPRRTF